MLFWEILCPERKEKRFVNIRRELLLWSELLTNTLQIIISKVFECEKHKLPSEGGREGGRGRRCHIERFGV